jgi:uncharacterized membrane protein YbhN (UPF0104 family)
MKNNLLSYLLGFISLFCLMIFIDLKDLRILFQVSFFSIFISCLFAIIIYLISGVQYYFIRKQFGISLEHKDILLLPIVGNLWSFIIPFQGNLMFTTIFFKKKYKMDVGESFSISIYLYLITISFTGIFILIYSIVNDIFYSWVSLISILMIINPLFLILTNLIFKKITFIKSKFFIKLLNFINSIIESTNKLWLNFKFTILMFLLDILKIAINILWFYWISKSLNFNLSLLSVAIMSLVMTISIILKFTPDNLGVAQFTTATFVSLIGGDPNSAALITLFASATALIVMLIIGVPGNVYYFKSLKLNMLVVKGALLKK